MLVFDEHSRAIIIDSVITPLTTDYFWVLDLDIMDFTLAPLFMLEETISPHHTLNIHGFSFKVPTPWHILIYSDETMEVDTVPIKKLSGKDFTSFISGFNSPTVIPGIIKVIDYQTEDISFGPSLNKNQMLCHPIAPDLWVLLSPSDMYNKYLKDCAVGNILY